MIDNIAQSNVTSSTLTNPAPDIESQVLQMEVNANQARPQISNTITPMQAPARNSSLGGFSNLALISCSAITGGAIGAAIGALSGYLTGAVGGAILDEFNAAVPFNNLGDLAGKQGALGNAVVSGTIGFFAGGLLACGPVHGDESNSTAASSTFLSSTALALAGNALGNVLLAHANQEHTTQIQGAAATATGIATFTAAATALSCLLLACACCGLTASAIAN